MSNWAYMVMVVAGVEPEGLGGYGAGIAAAPGEARGGETKVVADGVRDVLCG